LDKKLKMKIDILAIGAHPRNRKGEETYDFW
jgi:hypothetical protein